MEALHDWHEFYFMLGSSAAALVALLFVAISVGIGFFDRGNVTATRTFISSIVVHFSCVLFVAAMALVPGHAPNLVAIVLLAAGVVGAIVALISSVNIFREPEPIGLEIIDYFAYGIVPLIAYCKIIVAALTLRAHWEWGPELLATGVLLLLLINIRNAWDTVLTVVRRQTAREKAKRGKRKR
ncbi:MAG: hypothetical protein JO254_16455 [Pseudolabrys sp.]|nr:hypothetical protein [Pseudolabrys sp.]